jgi:HlyD family secretion protein
MRLSMSRILIGVILIGFLAMALMPILAPRPLAVDLHRVTRGSMQVTVSEQGRTRVKDLYIVSAPISGRMQRVDLDAGEPVVAGKTVLTRIEAPQPRFHDLREANEMQARVASAEAQRDLAAADVERAEAELAFAEAELKRNRDLANRGVASTRTLEAAELDVRVKRAALVVARNNLAAKTAEVAVAKASLIAPTGSSETGPTTQSNGSGNGRAPVVDSPASPPASPILAPIDGFLFRKLRESEVTVAVNEPLFELGDPTKLEVLVEMLSEDAAKVSPGDPASFREWGGDQVLQGVVRRVEPFGFTKISALGIEEQRVNVILDFTDPPAAWQRLGHGYRVDVSIQIWEGKDVLRLPIGAMFRQRNQWAVYRVDAKGIVYLQPVEIGHINNLEAEVTGGLSDDAVVILHPSDRLKEGMRVIPRDRDEA